MKTDHRTQLYLPQDTYRRIMERARSQGTSLAGIVREAVDLYLTTTGDDGARWDGDPFLQLVNELALPPRRSRRPLNEDIDATLYDEV